VSPEQRTGHKPQEVEGGERGGRVGKEECKEAEAESSVATGD